MSNTAVLLTLVAVMFLIGVGSVVTALGIAKLAGWIWLKTTGRRHHHLTPVRRGDGQYESVWARR